MKQRRGCDPGFVFIDGGKMHVLVIDDNEALATLYARALAGGGFAVTVALSGEEAIARAASQEVDFALVDVRMPGLDGPATVARLRVGRPALRFAYITGHSGDYQEEELLRSGALAVLSKPIDPTELTHALKRLMPACSPEQEA
jgi:CheY-like chemotaxis protein